MTDARGQLIHQLQDKQGILEVIDNGITRTLYFGNNARQSSILPASPWVLVLRYTRAMLAGLLFRPAPASVLLIGLGGGSLASFLLHRLPQCRVDVVEQRATVAELARSHFFLPDDERLCLHLGDGADYFDGPGQDRHYDLILVDAFDAQGMAPLLKDRHFLQSCRSHLTEDGALCANLWVSAGSRWRAPMKRLRDTFGENCLELPVAGHGNRIVLGLQQPCPSGWRTGLQPRSLELQERYGLDFPGMLAELQAVPPMGLWQLLG